MSFADISNRLADLEARLTQMVRVCTVVSVQDALGTVRVKLPDAGNMVSQPLPVLVRTVQDNKDYYLPDVGEQVLCVFLAVGLEQGFVLGSFYQEEDKPPVTSRNIRHIAFKDGSFMEYDRAAHLLTVSVQGGMNIKASEQIRLAAPQLVFEGNISASGLGGGAGDNSFDGNVAVDGDVTATGTIMDQGGNTPNHSHT